MISDPIPANQLKFAIDNNVQNPSSDSHLWFDSDLYTSPIILLKPETLAGNVVESYITGSTRSYTATVTVVYQRVSLDNIVSTVGVYCSHSSTPPREEKVMIVWVLKLVEKQQLTKQIVN